MARPEQMLDSVNSREALKAFGPHDDRRSRARREKNPQESLPTADEMLQVTRAAEEIAKAAADDPSSAAIEALAQALSPTEPSPLLAAAGDALARITPGEEAQTVFEEVLGRKDETAPVVEGQRFKGKIALVTGTRGVAKKVIELLTREGAEAIIATYTPIPDTPLGKNKQKRVDELHESVAEINREINGETVLDTQACDLADPEQRERFIAYVSEKYPQLDLIYLNAAHGFLRPRGKTDEEKKAELEAAHAVSKAVNYDSKIHFVKGFAKLLAKAKKPIVVNISSMLSRNFGKIPGIPEYDPVAAWKNAAELHVPVEVKRISWETGVSINFAEVCATGIAGTITWSMMQHKMAEQLAGMSEEGATDTDTVASAIVKLAVEENIPFGHIEWVGVPEKDRE